MRAGERPREPGAVRFVLAAMLCAGLLASAAWWFLGPGAAGGDGSGPDGTVRRTEDNPAAHDRATAAARRDAPGEALEPERTSADRPGETTSPSIDLVSGRLLDAAGSALVGQRVFCFSSLLAGPVWLDVRTEPDGSRFMSAVTDSGGRFVLELQEPAPSYSLYVAAEAHAPVLRRGVRPGDEVTLRAGRGRRLSGSVQSARAEPVPDASVRWRGTLGPVSFERQARSDVDGRFAIDHLPEWSRELADPVLAVTSSGFAPTTLNLAPGTTSPGVLQNDVEGIRVVLVLEEGVTWTGQVTDGEDGRPLSDVEVVLTLREPGRRRRPSSGRVSEDEPPSIRTRTDARGEYVLRHVPGLSFHVDSPSSPIADLRASRAGHDVATAALKPQEPGSTNRVDLVLWPAAAVRGRVVDETGAPRARVLIQARPAVTDAARPLPVERIVQARATTDEHGFFQFEAIPTLREPPTDIVFQFRATDPVEVTVSLAAGQSVELEDVVLARGGSAGVASGRAVVEVREAGGRPIGGAEVAQPGRRLTWQTTDAEGRVELRDPSPDEDEDVQVLGRAPGHAPSLSARFRFGFGEPPPLQVLVLEPEQRLRGRVVLPGGLPALGATVEVRNGLLPQEARDEFTAPIDPQDGVFPLADYGTVTADVRGHFEVGQLPPGPYRVRAWIEKGPSSEMVEVRDASQELRLVLQEPEEAVFLEGTVVDARTDRPLNQFKAVLRDSAELRMYQLSDRVARRVAPGRFRFEDVPAGRQVLHVSAPGYVAHEQTIEVSPEPGAQSVAVRLRAGVSVHGTVYLPPEVEPRRCVLLFLGAERNELVRAVPGPDGQYRAAGLQPGHYRVMVLHEDWDRAVASTADLDVPADRTELVHDVQTTAGGTLTLLLEPRKREEPHGHEPRSFPVVLRGADGRVYLNESMGFNHGLVMPLAPGTYQVEIQLGEGQVQTESIQIEVGTQPWQSIKVDVPPD